MQQSYIYRKHSYQHELLGKFVRSLFKQSQSPVMAEVSDVVAVIKDAVRMDQITSYWSLMAKGEEKVATFYCFALIQNLQSDITVASSKEEALAMIGLRLKQLESADNVFKDTLADQAIKTYIKEFKRWQTMLQDPAAAQTNVNPWDAILKITDLIEDHLSSSRTSSPWATASATPQQCASLTSPP